MNADVPQVECRLCGTLFAETDRFCPNCREPSPQVHEDLLMAARLTGVSYELLLQRAWAEEGLAPARRRAPAAIEETPRDPEQRGWVQRSVVDRIRGQRDAAAIGCVAIIALLVLGLVAFLLVQILDDGVGISGDDDDDIAGIAVTSTPTFEPETKGATANEGTATGTTGGTVGGGSGGTATAENPSPTPLPLILDAGQTATYADGYTALIRSYDNQVFSQNPEDTPAFGFRFVAIEVQACGGEQAVEASPGDWLLEMPDGEQYEPSALLVEPQLAESRLEAGACAEGWITYEIPIDPDPLYIVHVNPSYATVHFAWPG